MLEDMSRLVDNNTHRQEFVCCTECYAASQKPLQMLGVAVLESSPSQVLIVPLILTLNGTFYFQETIPI